MQSRNIHMVTGAYGFSGKYIAGELLKSGVVVSTITNSPNRKNDFGDQLKAVEFNFDNHDKLVESLADVCTLYNTYWVRFNHKNFSHKDAVENTLRLFKAAKEAGVGRVVHTSITNPSLDSNLEYFSGKAILEKALIESGMSYSILRPAVIFGDEDILINNIAWILRKLPIFPVFGYGSYRIQPIYVEDFAQLAIREGQNRENVIINAVGPETYSYRQLIEKIGDILCVNKPIINVTPEIGYIAGTLIGKIVKDVIVTKEEIKGLMADLLCVDSTPTGKTKLSDWVVLHKDTLGHKYSSELARRLNRERAYA
ncbi:MAG: NAD-dependent epimerase/dehydratase family protein [Thermodesulfobacteriota bacterium]